jgi:LPXTG-motif cell wall-anchored protein
VLPTPAGVTVGGSSSGGTTGSSGGTGTSGGSGSSTGTGSTGSSAGTPGKLAYTGVDATPMVVAGVLFLAFGTGALLLTRRRRRS